MLSIPRRSFLLGSAATLGASLLAVRRTALASGTRPPRRLIIAMAGGGWDPTATLDPKPGLSSIDVLPGSVQEFDGLPVYVDGSRPAVAGFFSEYASLCTIVNGIQVQSLNHPDCAKRLLTGTSSDTSADVGAMTAHALAPDLAAPYLVLGQTAFSGPYASISARAGTANQLGTLLDPARAYAPADDPLNFTPRLPLDDAEEQLIRDHVRTRAERELAARGTLGENQRRLQDFIDSLARGDALAAADFGDFAYTGDFVVQATLAVDLLEAGLSHAAQIELGDWDTHTNNLLQIPKWEQFFAGLRTLVDELASRPGMAAGDSMLDDTVVLVASEMARTPKLNAQGGKDHWPVTSAMLIGGGLPGGRVLGGTDDGQLGITVDLQTGLPSEGGDLVQYGNFAAGVLQAVGVDAGAYLPGVEPFGALCG